MSADIRLSLAVLDGRASARLVGGTAWKRRFAAAGDDERRDLVEQLNRAVRRELDDLCHLLVFTGNPDVAARRAR